MMVSLTLWAKTISATTDLEQKIQARLDMIRANLAKLETSDFSVGVTEAPASSNLQSDPTTKPNSPATPQGASNHPPIQAPTTPSEPMEAVHNSVQSRENPNPYAYVSANENNRFGH